MENNILIWLWVKLAVNDSSEKSYALFKHFKSAAEIYKCTQEQLKKLDFLSDAEKEKLLIKDLLCAKNIYSLCQNADIDVITIEDEKYPENLLEISIPPCVLFIYGDYEKAISKPKIAIVGTRECTEYGYHTTAKFSSVLSLHGYTIVTGIAKGVDEAAYTAALKTGGNVIVFSPDGKPFQEIISKRFALSSESSVIISEHLPHCKQTKYAYHERNRLISGIADCCLITQAPEKSGALITAACALEQNKDIYVIPANIDIIQSRGSNLLIRDGATPIFSYEDLMNFLGTHIDNEKMVLHTDAVSFLTEKEDIDIDTKIDVFKKSFEPHLSALAKKVLSVFDEKPITLDYICAAVASETFSILPVLTELSAMGIIVEDVATTSYLLNLKTEDSKDA